MKKLSKSQIIIPLIIGVSATALWEKIISPFCTFVYVHISSLVEKLSITFSNNTYKEIANGFNDSLFINIFTILFACVFYFFIFGYIFFHIKTYKTILGKIDSDANDKSSLIIITTIILNIGLIVFSYYIGNISYINHCKTKSLCNIEIVSPYISDQEYKELKSTFYSIQSKGDYNHFESLINVIGEEYSLKLKE